MLREAFTQPGNLQQQMDMMKVMTASLTKLNIEILSQTVHALQLCNPDIHTFAKASAFAALNASAAIRARRFHRVNSEKCMPLSFTSFDDTFD